MDEILRYCDHIIFNSPSQFKRYRDRVKAAGRSMGLRINPECSTQEGMRSMIHAPRFLVLGQLPENSGKR